VQKNYYDYGIRVFWLDNCEPDIQPPDFENVRMHLGNGAEVACAYPMLNEKGFYDALQQAGQQEIVTLCRSGWAGSQRFGAIIWSGDIPSTFASLRQQIRAGLNMAMSGIPWWTTDIGGFHGGNPDEPAFQELIVRWFQYGVFCPIFRLHGVREPSDWKSVPTLTGADNEIWSFGQRAYAIIRELLMLRQRLMPYIMAQMDLAAARGIPPMRPLFFDFADDAETYRWEDQFLFGPDVIVAPVAEPGATSRKVYLPAGCTWRNAWTDECVDGGRIVEAACPLETIPVYLRDTSTLQLRNAGQPRK
jgi:alpha-D-xyloside xylohydrolase